MMRKIFGIKKISLESRNGGKTVRIKEYARKTANIGKNVQKNY